MVRGNGLAPKDSKAGHLLNWKYPKPYWKKRSKLFGSFLPNLKLEIVSCGRSPRCKTCDTEAQLNDQALYSGFI
jgi:hypothetical protein